MTAPDNFLSRWSRRKREADTPMSLAHQRAARSEPEAAENADDGSEPAEFVPQGKAATEQSPELPGPDLESLPSVESIAENTDIRGFLRAGVPPDLTRSALRRAWASDPSIRDFIGIAENQWDFNDPSAIPGFGPLSGINDAPALLKQALGRIDEVAEAIPDLLHASRSTPTAEMVSRSDVLDGADVDARSLANQAAAEIAGSTESAGADTLPPPHRPHGGALPR